MNSALREMLIKIGIVSDVAGAQKAEKALDDTTAAARKLDETGGRGAGTADSLAGALDDAAGAAQKAGGEIAGAAGAADSLATGAAAGAQESGGLAEALGQAAVKGGLTALALKAATDSLSLAIRLTREYVEALRAEARAIDEQQSRNHAGAIEMTREAISRLGEEYDKLAAKRRADLAAQKDQITAEKEYNLAVNERQMQQAIAAAPGDEKRIRKEYGARAKVLGSASDRAAIEAELAAAEQEQAAAEAHAAEMREKETRANEEYDQAQQHKAAMERERDEKIAAAEARLPLDDRRRALYGNLYVDLVYDAPRNRSKRAKEVAGEYTKRIEDAGKANVNANAAANAAQDEREAAEAEAAAARARRDTLMQRAHAQVIRGESAEIEQQRAGKPLSKEEQAEAQAMQADAQRAYDKAARMAENAASNEGAAREGFNALAEEAKLKGDLIIQSLTEKFGAIAEKLQAVETAQRQDRENARQSIQKLAQQWDDLASRVASLPS